jgi:C4-dicarboxylate-binding protein DctP
MHEVQKHVAMTDHGYLGYAVITNKKFWDGLPPDVRAGLEAAMAEATVYANQIARQENEDSIAKVKASGKSAVYTPTAEERAAWKKALVSVHKDMESRIGKDTIQSVYAETGFKPD